MAPFVDKAANLGLAISHTTVKLRTYFDRRLFSLWLFQTWIFLVFHSPLIISPQSTLFSTVYSLTIVFAVAALLFGVFFRYHRKVRVNILVAATLFAVAGTAGIHFFTADSAGRFIGPALLGTGIGLLLPFIGKLFSSATFKIAARQTFLSFSLATLLYFLILGLPWVVSIILVSLLPVTLSIVLLSTPSTSHTAQPSERDVVRELVTSRPIVMFFIGVALLGVAFGFSMSINSLSDPQNFGSNNSWALLLAGVLAFVYFLLLRRSKDSFDFERCFSPVTPSIIVGLMLVSFSHSVSSVLIIAGYQLSDMVIWVVFTWIAGHSGLPQRVFCIGKGSMYGGMLIGSTAAWIVSTFSGSDALPLAAATVVACLLVFAIVFVFNNSQVTMVIKSSSKNYELTYIAQAIAQRCDELGTLFALTAREKELLVFLVQGRSLPYIEKAAHISHGTANSHRDHIYSKMNVHSKQELLNLFFGNRE